MSIVNIGPEDVYRQSTDLSTKRKTITLIAVCSAEHMKLKFVIYQRKSTNLGKYLPLLNKTHEK